ncbi:hypothetical protein PanWU01x14_294490, partial [Parasponia andersonii]
MRIEASSSPLDTIEEIIKSSPKLYYDHSGSTIEANQARILHTFTMYGSSKSFQIY